MSASSIHDYPADGGGMVIKRNGLPPRIRKIVTITGSAINQRRLGVNSPDLNTLCSAVYGRVLHYSKDGVVQPAVRVQANAFRLLDGFKRRFLACYGKRPIKASRAMFVEMYVGRKRAIYQDAVDSLVYFPLKRDDSFTHPFVKCEKGKIDGCAHVIQPRSPRYNVEVGVYLKHLEHGVFRSISRCFKQKKVVMKGINVKQIGGLVLEYWYSYSDPAFIGLDASRFDMHVSQGMLGFEHSLYLALYDYDPSLVTLLKWQLSTKGVGYCVDGKMSYKIKGRRLSGDMNTSMGNCIIMCSMCYSYIKYHNIKCKFINNGDDCGFVCERRDIGLFSGIADWLLGFGFRAVVEKPVYELELIRFCQMAPIKLDDGGCVMVRELGTALEKDSMIATYLQNVKAVRKWMYSVGIGGLSGCGGIPVMQEFYSMYMRLGLKSRIGLATYMDTGFSHLVKDMKPRWAPVGPHTRESFYVAFGLNAEEQIALEKRYIQLDTLGWMGDYCADTDLPMVY